MPILFVRRRNARRYILRVDDEGRVRLTIPRGGSLEHAKSFADRHAEWVLAQQEKRQKQLEARKESEKNILFRGELLPLVIAEGNQVAFGTQQITVPDGQDLRLTIKERLWELGGTELPGRVMELAMQHGLQVRKVTVRDQRSRWGSCSRRGNISLNYRLVQTPEFVRDYVIVHELMHLREMNHSSRFWNLVYAAFPRTEEARKWLRKNGKLTVI